MYKTIACASQQKWPVERMNKTI